jgi:anaerobic selenocysteine-containing dehydrogenase
VRCTLLIHPDDASRFGIVDGQRVEVRSSRGVAEFPAEISVEMMPGVVSAPHGWGHDRDGARIAVASAHAGASVNDVTDDTVLDRLSGNAAFSAMHVTIRPAQRSDKDVAAQ